MKLFLNRKNGLTTNQEKEEKIETINSQEKLNKEIRRKSVTFNPDIEIFNEKKEKI